MSHTLTFATLYEYDSRREGIELPVVLRSGARSVALRAPVPPFAFSGATSASNSASTSNAACRNGSARQRAAFSPMATKPC
ncbi:MAG: hypothetical protein HY011_09095 [Acidobacteria bacterium]|nr:hypothetical protein [Acidobacteriota bacterium]